MIFKESKIGVNNEITLLILYKDKEQERNLNPEFYQATRNMETILEFRYAKEMYELKIANEEEVLDFICGDGVGIAHEWEHRAIIANEQLYADEYLAFENAN